MDDYRKFEDQTVNFEDALTKTGNGLYNILMACTCSLTLLAISTDLFGFSLVVAAACDLNLTVYERGILTSLPFVGIILVSFLWGYISDTRGRRFTLVLCLPLGFIFSCISSFASNWLVLGLFKFFSVCFSCAANSVAYTWMGESCTQLVRSRYMLLMTSLLLLGPAFAGVLTYPTLKYISFKLEISWLGLIFTPWRLLIIILSLPFGIGALAVLFFHESPKFLANWGKNEEALEVLKSIYAINHRCSKNEFKVKSLKLEESTSKKTRSLFRSILDQSLPLFKPPLLLRTLQLFYIVSVVYITNNSFLVWLAYILNLVRISFDANEASGHNICSIISVHRDSILGSPNATSVNVTTTTTEATVTTPEVCTGEIADNVIITLVVSQSIFAFLNFVISCLPHRRKTMLIVILVSSGASGILLNLVPEPITSVMFFVIFTCTCLAMGILASYFVELYPTSYRGMISSLSILVARASTFVGINLVAVLLFNHCHATFYVWAGLVLSSAGVSLFLPPDKPPAKMEATKL